MVWSNHITTVLLLVIVGGYVCMYMCASVCEWVDWCNLIYASWLMQTAKMAKSFRQQHPNTIIPRNPPWYHSQLWHRYHDATVHDERQWQHFSNPCNQQHNHNYCYNRQINSSSPTTSINVLCFLLTIPGTCDHNHHHCSGRCEYNLDWERVYHHPPGSPRPLGVHHSVSQRGDFCCRHCWQTAWIVRNAPRTCFMLYLGWRRNLCSWLELKSQVITKDTMGGVF